LIITISGKPGTGKTSAAKEIARRLNYAHYSMGDMRGLLAQSKGLTIDELNELNDPETHRHVDEFQATLGKETDNFVTDGWLSWYFISHSYKVFLKADEDVAAVRIYNAERGADEPKYGSLLHCKETVSNRFKVTREATMGLYEGADLADESNYDLVIDTTHLTVAEVMEKILLNL
jgi:CMP/dCMP kinase